MNEKQVKCPQCDRFFKEARHMKIHARLAHGLNMVTRNIHCVYVDDRVWSKIKREAKLAGVGCGIVIEELCEPEPDLERVNIKKTGQITVIESLRKAGVI
jgi:uncharacterized C2H2 Zn-finger protein